ncbi:MAG: thermonuclease family protein [Bauldia sp.]|nr:thermonuclease family protein [Bauldia sp.]
MSRSISIILLAAIAAGPAIAAERGFADAGCELVPGIAGRVEAIIDATTLRLEGGAELRLAGLEPVAPSPATAAAAMTFLADVALGRTVEVRYGPVSADRYGRSVGHAWLVGTATEPSLGVLLAGAGLARVSAPLGDASCTGALLAAERAARDAGLGLWPENPPLGADDEALRTAGDDFALVEGRILSIGRRERTVYLNFGRDWSTDFTVSMTAAVAEAIEAAGGPLDALVGQRVRIRGLLAHRDGPWIRVDGAWQIEILDDADGR